MTSKKKFKLKSELELFKALQLFGKLTLEKLSEKTGISGTTLHGIYQRLQKRKFYEIKAVPKLELFPEIPMAFIGFSDVHPTKLEKLRDEILKGEEFRIIAHSENDILLFLVDENSDRLHQQIHDITKKLESIPSLRITTPSIAKMDITIPGKVLDKIYADLPDKRRK